MRDDFKAVRMKKEEYKGITRKKASKANGCKKEERVGIKNKGILYRRHTVQFQGW